ncbi:MAG: phosphate acyltransferase PlsX [Anaerolineales bacterium]|nr:MAG: phosphate acyltransferase PlsX [Anaerolineales bacterium]
MCVVVDAMGSDARPEPEILGALQAVKQFGDPVILVGDEEQIMPRINQLGSSSLIRVVHAPETLEMTDKPAENARRKAQNSMAIGMDLIKSGEGQVFVTMGNTGGAMANALFRLGRIRGVKRPALTQLFPVRTGHCVVTDIGANADCKPEYLLQFAIMGSVYAEKMLSISKPRVGLLSNGEEPGKGNDLVKAAFPLLQASGLNFIGNVEGKELFGGHVDVVVTDGFTGNIMLKSSEAVAKLITDTLRQELTRSLQTKIGALLSKSAFTKLKQMLDPAEYGAAPLLGINGLVFVGHGRSDERAILNAIRVARQAVKADLLISLQNSIQDKLSIASFSATQPEVAG